VKAPTEEYITLYFTTKMKGRLHLFQAVKLNRDFSVQSSVSLNISHWKGKNTVGEDKKIKTNSKKKQTNPSRI